MHSVLPKKYIVGYHFEYDSSNKGNVKVIPTIECVMCHNFTVGKSKLVFPPTQPARIFSNEELEDLLKIKYHISEIHSDINKDVFQWPTATTDGDAIATTEKLLIGLMKIIKMMFKVFQIERDY